MCLEMLVCFKSRSELGRRAQISRLASGAGVHIPTPANISFAQCAMGSMSIILGTIFTVLFKSPLYTIGIAVGVLISITPMYAFFFIFPSEEYRIESEGGDYNPSRGVRNTNVVSCLCEDLTTTLNYLAGASFFLLIAGIVVIANGHSRNKLSTTIVGIVIAALASIPILLVVGRVLGKCCYSRYMSATAFREVDYCYDVLCFILPFVGGGISFIVLGTQESSLALTLSGVASTLLGLIPIILKVGRYCYQRRVNHYGGLFQNTTSVNYGSLQSAADEEASPAAASRGIQTLFAQPHDSQDASSLPPPSARDEDDNPSNDQSYLSQVYSNTSATLSSTYTTLAQALSLQ